MPLSFKEAFDVLVSLFVIIIYGLKNRNNNFDGNWQKLLYQLKGKSVSISSDPVTENGPCTKKEEEMAGGENEEHCSSGGAEGGIDDELHAVAVKLVEDVVRLASEAAGEKAAASDAQTEGTGETTRPNKSLERLPTICIETVPSMPPSPTDWPPPPPEDTILEEDETLDESQIEIQMSIQEQESDIPEEIRKFAANYIEELLVKAMELAEERQKSEDAEAAREIAARMVDDVISRASESASERLSIEKSFAEALPTIQIDTVVSMPPSPTEEDEPQPFSSNAAEGETAKPRPPIPEITYMQFEDEESETKDEKEKTTLGNLVKYAEAPEEIREFASSYVKDIISKAVTMAEEKLVNTVPFNFEDADMMKVNGPWYIRVRETLMRVLRSACFCTPRRDDS